jgi:hypothetical protein
MQQLLISLVLAASCALAQTSAPGTAQKPGPSTGGKTASTPHKGSPGPTKAATVDPDEGSVDEQGVYTSDYFRFRYTLPEGFEVDENFLAEIQDESKNAYILMAATGPFNSEDTRNVVVIVADHEATTAEAYVQKVTQDYAQKQALEVVKPAYAITLGGKPFYRADFRKEGTYQTVAFTMLKAYAVGFSMAAPNQDAMQSLLQSLESVQFLPDKTPGKASGTGTGKSAPAGSKAPSKSAPKGTTPNAASPKSPLR